MSLVNDRESLLDVTSLGHTNKAAVVAHVEDAVLLEDGAEHALHNDRGLRIADETRFFLQLAGEEVDTEVSVLACLWGRRDADDLAWSALKDDEVADADELAGDGNSISGAADAWLNEADVLAVALAVADWTTVAVFFDDDFLADLNIVVAVVVTTAEGVDDAVKATLDTAAEGVVLAFVVVVAHVVSASGDVYCGLFVFETDAFLIDWSTALVLDVVG